MPGHWILRELIHISGSLGRVLGLFYLPLAAGLTAWNFPYDLDDSIHRARTAPPVTLDQGKNFYDAAYDEKPVDSAYIDVEKSAATMMSVKENLAGVIAKYGLNGKVLEVGSGTGQLQDLVDDYTGLDISSTVRRYYHKPFVAASATDMPFPDNTFDAMWSIWVLEHIPEPERALQEMRRVLKPGGVLFLAPAWHCGPWLSEGYPFRPYSDFGIGGKLIKASVPIRQYPLFETLHWYPTRAIRLASTTLDGGPSRFKQVDDVRGRRLDEERGANERKGREQRNAEGRARGKREPGAGRTIQGTIERAGASEREERERRTGDDLVGAPSNDEQGEDRRDHRAP